MTELYGGREERTGTRDQSMNDWLRTLKDCPFADLDFVGFAFNQLEPVSIIDWKHIKAEGHTYKTCEASLEGMRRLANRAKVSFFVVFWNDDKSWFAVMPSNELAREIVPRYVRMSARKFAAIMYAMSGRTATDEVLNQYPDADPPPKTIAPSNIDELFDTMVRDLDKQVKP